MNRKGFTLIELISVVIIVGILARIAAPMLSGMTTKAMCTEGVMAMGTIREACREYFLNKNQIIFDFYLDTTVPLS